MKRSEPTRARSKTNGDVRQILAALLYEGKTGGMLTTAQVCAPTFVEQPNSLDKGCYRTNRGLGLVAEAIMLGHRRFITVLRNGCFLVVRHHVVTIPRRSDRLLPPLQTVQDLGELDVTL
jgi:hypothetical protein